MCAIHVIVHKKNSFSLTFSCCFVCKVISLNVIDTKKRKNLQWRPLHGSLSGSFYLFIFLCNFIYLFKFISSSEIATERSVVKNKVR